MDSRCKIISAAVLAAVLANVPVHLEATATDQPAPVVPGRFTLSAAAGDEVQNYTADLLVPLWFSQDSLIFFNPRVSLTDHDGSAEEFNLGLGARKLIGESLIFGANIYYDHRFAATDRQYDQLGAGVELLSPWVDARCNYYLPENDREVTDSFDQIEQRRTSRSWWEDPYAAGHGIWQKRRTETITTTITHRYEYYEQAMEGWDAEIGVKVPGLPDWLETRLFLGGYRFDAPYGDDVQGWKGRIEVRPVRGLVIDAARYEDDELYGADWLVGARLSVPVDITNLLAGGNPFQGLKEWFRPGKQPFIERLGEMVMRDPQIHTEQWGPLENLEKKRVDVKEERSVKRYTLLNDVMFVDAGRSGAWENGTWEYPFNLVQEGVNGASGKRNVYVNAFDGSYRENVVLRSGTQLYGSGWPISGHGGKSFGSGIQPIIDGGGNGPVIRLASDNSIRGFHLVNRVAGAPQQESGSALLPIFVENSAIFGSGQLGTTIIEGNTISCLSNAISLIPSGGTITIQNNTIDTDMFGILILADNADVESISLIGNSISADEAGIVIGMSGTTLESLAIRGNSLVPGTSSEIGLALLAENSIFNEVIISDNDISGDLFGIYSELYFSSFNTITVANNLIQNSTFGIQFRTVVVNVDNLIIVDNSILHSALAGIVLESDTSQLNNVAITNNHISADYAALGIFSIESSVRADISANYFESPQFGIFFQTVSSGTIDAYTSGLPNTIISGVNDIETVVTGGPINNSVRVYP